MSPFFVKLIWRFLSKSLKRRINLTKKGKDPSKNMMETCFLTDLTEKTHATSTSLGVKEAS
jgi:hypothetical protein